MRYVTMEPLPSDLQFKARMTNAQFRALAALVNHQRIAPELRAMIHGSSWRKSSTYSFDNTSRWLKNGWNTERVMRLQADLDEESKKFALHWLFPQAYYACFCQLMALYGVVGHTESAHTAVIRKFGELVQQAKYPPVISWYATGGMRDIRLHNVARCSAPASYYLDLDDEATVHNQVAQLLASTREIHLEQKRDDLRKEFRTRKGSPKKHLRRDEWARVSERLGPTSLLSFLYRKRIKANYRDIDTFLESEISGAQVTDNLICIVDGLATVHETYIWRALGRQDYERLYESSRDQPEFMDRRRAFLESL